MKKRILCAALAVLVVMSMFTGCSKEETTADGVQKLSYFSAMPSGSENPIFDEIERINNIDLKMYTAADDQRMSRLSTLVASGEIPDVINLLRFDVFHFIPQGIIQEITDEMLEKYAPTLYAQKNGKEKDYWKLMKYDGKTYAIPTTDISGKNLLVARKDWMEKVGITKNPETLDEFVEMLRKFTFDDPDGNGKNDTYGLMTLDSVNGDYLASFTPIFCAFGVQPQQERIIDGKLYADSISEGYKESIKVIANLYKEGVLDPESFIHKSEQAKTKVVRGKAGSFCAGWFQVPGFLTTYEMEKLQPGVKWEILDPPTGPDGKSGYMGKSPIVTATAITTSCKNPETYLKLAEWFTTDEAYNLTNHGIEGVHYTEIGKRTEEGEKLFQQNKLTAYAAWTATTDRKFENWKNNEPHRYPYALKAANANLYLSDMYGIITDTYNTLFPDIKKIEEEWFIKFVTGNADIEKDWDKYVAQWKKKGGVEILESMVEVYNERNNTKIVVGETK